MWKWRPLQFRGDCLAGADLYITGNAGWPRYAWDASGRRWQETLTDIDLIDLGLGEGPRGGGVHVVGLFAIHIPLRPALSSVKPREGFSFVWGTCYLAGIGQGRENDTGKQTWEEEDEEGVITAPTRRHSWSDWIGLDCWGFSWDLEPGRVILDNILLYIG